MQFLKAIKIVSSKELKEIFREGRFRLLAAIIMFLLLLSAVVSYQYQKQLQELHRQAQLTERKVWEMQKSKNPHGAAHFGQYVFKPVYPLSVIDPGIDRYTGVMQYLEAHKRNHEQFSSVQDQTELARLADLTPSFVLLFLVPVLLIVTGFSSITKERENGSLKILLSQGASSFQIAAGKWIAVWLSVAVSIIPAFLLLSIFLFTKPGFHISTFSLFMLSYLMYYAVIAGVTIIFSSIVKKSGTAFILTLLFWVVTTLLVPKLLSGIAAYQAPLLSNDAISKLITKMNVDRGGNIHDLSGPIYKQLVDSLLKQYKVDSVAQLPVNMAGIRLDMGEQMDTRQYQKVYDSLFKQINHQQLVLQKGFAVSPYLTIHAASMHLAQTDWNNHHHFSDAGESYRRELVNRMNRFIAYDSKKQEAFTQFDAPESLWKTVPEFTYMPLMSSQIIANSSKALLSLLLWLVGTATALLFISKRIQP